MPHSTDVLHRSNAYCPPAAPVDPTQQDGCVPAAHADSVRVLILSDVRLYRDVLTQAVGASPGVHACDSVDSLEAARARLEEDSDTIVVVDMGRPQGAAAARELAQAVPHARIVAFGVGDADADVLACAEAGAAGFVQRSGSVAELADVIDDVRDGRVSCSPRVVAMLFRHLAALAMRPANPAAIAELTRRERQIIDLIDGGMSNKEIAGRLHIELATVKNHVHRILEKLAVKRRGEAAAWVRTNTSGRSAL